MEQLYFVGNYRIPGVQSCSLNECISYLKDKSLLGFDTETTGLDPHSDSIVMIQIGDLDRQFVIDARCTDLGPLFSFLQDSSAHFVGANIRFDLKMLLKHGVRLSNVIDILLQETVLINGLIHHKNKPSLKRLALKYLELELEKEVRIEFTRVGNKKFVKHQVIYGYNDVILPLKIHELQTKKIIEDQLEYCVRLENDFTKVIAEMEFNGMPLDASKWAALARENEEGIKTALKSLDDYVVEKRHYRFLGSSDLFSNEPTVNISWTSNKQVVKYFNFLGLDTRILDKDKSKKAGKKVFKDSIGKDELPKFKHEFVDLYRVFVKYQKACSTYGHTWLKKFVNPLTKRVHSNFRQILNTGRMASTSPNVQQIPSFKDPKNKKSYEAHRTCFVAPEGRTLIVRDYSNQELRVLADLSQEPSMIDAFINGDGDLHSATARKIFKTEVSSSVNKHLRSIGKTMNFALSYGASMFKIAKSLNVSVEEAKEIIDSFFSAFPKLEKFFTEGHNFVEKHGYVLVDTVTNRRSYMPQYRQFKALRKKIRTIQNEINYAVRAYELGMTEELSVPSLDKDDIKTADKMLGKMKRASQNYRIQGLSASMTKLALNMMYEWVKQNGLFTKVWFVLALHDEIVMEADEDVAEAANVALQQFMEEAGAVFCKKVPIKSDGGLTKIWDH